MYNLLSFFVYFTCFTKVQVAYGERFETGKVAEACENAGMKALCWGDDTCHYTKKANSRQVSNESALSLIEQFRCQVTKYNLGCGNNNNKNTLTKV